MRSLLLVLGFLFGATEASGKPLQVFGSYGELVDSQRRCGPVTRAEIWRWFPGGMGLRLELEVDRATIVPVSDTERRECSAATGATCETSPIKKPLASDKAIPSVGRVDYIWNLGKRSIVIAVFPERTAMGRIVRTVWFSMLVESDTVSRDQVSCFERWVGTADVRSAP